MSNSLKDQLLGLGFSAPKPEPRKPQPPKKGGQGGKPARCNQGMPMALAGAAGATKRGGVRQTRMEHDVYSLVCAGQM